MGHLPFNFLKSAIFLPVPVSCKLQRQIEARRSRSRDDFDIASAKLEERSALGWIRLP
jgi:hypothetical protein